EQRCRLAEPVVSSEAHILPRLISMSTFIFVFLFQCRALQQRTGDIKEANSTSETYSVSSTYFLFI
ncbi:hypothetical protein, partial [Marinobacterium halophilum]|uniref:hypothetical protein n=1 Tax=Marinobacterium halophilum TaxID=267374 RepID=UPI001B805754